MICKKVKVGIADTLKACDKQIGYERLSNLELSPAAKNVFEERLYLVNW